MWGGFDWEGYNNERSYEEMDEFGTTCDVGIFDCSAGGLLFIGQREFGERKCIGRKCIERNVIERVSVGRSSIKRVSAGRIRWGS